MFATATGSFISIAIAAAAAEILGFDAGVVLGWAFTPALSINKILATHEINIFFDTIGIKVMLIIKSEYKLDLWNSKF